MVYVPVPGLDDARDRRLALAGRAVARVVGELDLRRDRLLVDRLVLVAAGDGLLGVGVDILGPRRAVLAVQDDVDLEVGARDGRLDTRRGLLLLEVVVVGHGLGRRLGGGGLFGGRRLGRRRGGLLLGGGALRRGGLLLVLRVLRGLVGHA